VGRYLAALRAEGVSARTCNRHRVLLVSFGTWCVKSGRLASNPLRALPVLDAERDRRYERRPLTEAELRALLEVAEARGPARIAWYLGAALAGLRRGDLERMRWADLDLGARTLTIRQGKAKRVDVLPLAPELAEAFERLRAQAPVLPSALVFPRVSCKAVRADFEAAGIPREDEAGRRADLHSLRGTFASWLARRALRPRCCADCCAIGRSRPRNGTTSRCACPITPGPWDPCPGWAHRSSRSAPRARRV
jgi:integrase